MKEISLNKGITLVTLVVTIGVLLILDIQSCIGKKSVNLTGFFHLHIVIPTTFVV